MGRSRVFGRSMVGPRGVLAGAVLLVAALSGATVAVGAGGIPADGRTVASIPSTGTVTVAAADFNAWRPGQRLFGIVSITRTPGDPDMISITFQTAPIRLYNVKSTDDIATEPFTTSMTLEGDGSLTTIGDATGGTNRFYQIGVPVP